MANSDPSSETLSDAEAIASVLDGNVEDFAVLVRRYHAPLLRTAHLRLGHRQAAEDAVQESLVSAFRSLRSYDSSYSFRVWLWAIMQNECRRRYREFKKKQAAEFERLSLGERDAVTDDAAADFEHAEELDRVMKLVGQLPNDQAEAIRLRFAGEMKYADLAQLCGCSLATAKNRVRRGLTALSRMMRSDAT